MTLRWIKHLAPDAVKKEPSIFDQHQSARQENLRQTFLLLIIFANKSAGRIVPRYVAGDARRNYRRDVSPVSRESSQCSGFET